MSLYNATIGTATKLVISSGNMADDILLSGTELTGSMLNKAKELKLSTAISLAVAEETAVENGELRRYNALWNLAEQKAAHKARMAKNPDVLAEYNRLAGIAP